MTPGLQIHEFELFCQDVYPSFLWIIVGLSPAVAMVSSEIVSGPVAIGNFLHLLPGCGIGEAL